MIDADNLIEAAVKSGFWQAVSLILGLKLSRQARGLIMEATTPFSAVSELGRERFDLLRLPERTPEQDARVMEIEEALMSIPRMREREDDRRAMDLIRQAAKELEAS
jgi:hypothetical protein